MNKRTVLRNSFLLILFCVPLVSTGIVTESILSLIKTGDKIDAVLELPSVMSSVKASPEFVSRTGEERIETFIGLLESHTTRAQQPLLSIIRRHVAIEDIEPFWISNKIFLKNVTPELVQAIKHHPGDHILRLEGKVRLISPIEINNSTVQNSSRATKSPDPDWGLVQIGAPLVWAKGYTGQGVTVAGMDTGVYVEHEAIKDSYAMRWADGTSNGRPRDPYDDDGHGTLTIGTFVGTHGVGVAYGAKWVACKMITKANKNPEKGVVKCAQFLLSLRGNRPRIISNSWIWDETGAHALFDDEIDAWRTAEIIPVFALGNSGPSCNTAHFPGSDPRVIGVGATNANDHIGSFSSKGYPPGSTKIKPDLSAPGVSIKGPWNTSKIAYRVFSGTSLATPMVAGGIALMLSKDPTLKYPKILNILQTTAYRPVLTPAESNCGTDVGGWPNNVYGYGRIDLNRAIDAVNAP